MKNLEPGDCYAIWHGIFAGKSMVYIESIGEFNYFLIMTTPFKIGKFTTKSLLKAQKDITLDEHEKIPGYIDFIENIPEQVFNCIKSQYDIEKIKKHYITDIFEQRKNSLIER